MAIQDLTKRKMIMRSSPELILICLAFSLITTSAATQEVKRVYIASSYEKNHICGGPQLRTALWQDVSV
jgi:hypothetical protein